VCEIIGPVNSLLPALLAGGLFWANAADKPAAPPLPRAHSHNDYEHPRPLLDALDHGFCSVEVDIYAIDGQLLVAHDRARVDPKRTLQALYLDPLRDRVRSNRGRVFPGDHDFFLLIDFKTPSDVTWSALAPVLDEYAEMLTVFAANRTETNAVTIVLSGNSPRSALAATARRRAAIDGRLPDLDGAAGARLVPWISENWRARFSWRGQGEMPPGEAQRLADLVQRAHAQGRRVRFWGGPDIEPVWRVQHAAGVDLINTDKLAELRAFLLGMP
jgi:glycerophosphoryl diester phosphodiesterase